MVVWFSFMETSSERTHNFSEDMMDVYISAGYDIVSHSPTSPLTVLTITGIDVRTTVMVPKRLIDRQDSAAARGSDKSKSAVAIADEFAPNVTPRVT